MIEFFFNLKLLAYHLFFALNHNLYTIVHVNMRTCLQLVRALCKNFPRCLVMYQHHAKSYFLLPQWKTSIWQVENEKMSNGICVCTLSGRNGKTTQIISVLSQRAFTTLLHMVIKYKQLKHMLNVKSSPKIWTLKKHTYTLRVGRLNNVQSSSKVHICHREITLFCIHYFKMCSWLNEYQTSITTVDVHQRLELY